MIPKIAEFMESLTHEQDKLVMMGTIKLSKDQALVVVDSMVDSKGKNLGSHLSKRETRNSLWRSHKVPRRTTKKRKTKVE